MIRESCKLASYGNTGLLFQPIYVLSAVLTVISSSGDQTSDYRKTSPHDAQLLPNQLVMANAWPL